MKIVSAALVAAGTAGLLATAPAQAARPIMTIAQRPPDWRTEVGPSTTPRRRVDMARLVREFGPPPADAVLPIDGGSVPQRVPAGQLVASATVSRIRATAAAYSRRVVCARDVWVRDSPAGWSHGIMYKGDGFRPTEYRDSGWAYGDPEPSSGNSNGWVIRSAFCPT